MDFSETIVVYDLKLATDDRSDKKFLLTSKLFPQGTVCPLPRGYIHLDFEMLIDPVAPSGGSFGGYDFLKAYSKSCKIKHVSTLTVGS